MKISKGGHKSLLLGLFYQPNPRAHMPGELKDIEKKFPTKDLLDVYSSAKKLSPIVRELTGEEIKNFLNGKEVIPEELEKIKKDVKMTVYEDTEIEFTPSEIVILKKLFDDEKDWPWTKAEIFKELKEIFYPPIPIEK